MCWEENRKVKEGIYLISILLRILKYCGNIELI